MTQIQFILFFYALPILCGLIAGIILWKTKKSHLILAALYVIYIVALCVISNINLHGNEGPGILLGMYFNFVLAFSAVEVIKFLKGKKV